MSEEKSDELFWADQLANKIINRDKFLYTDDKIEKPKTFVVKTSASLSGVLHIGRLSDTIRGSSVYQALNDAGVKAKLIWVAEDMDPFRKVPKGIHHSFDKYLGMPVTDVPDPDDCHSSYAEHFKAKYFEVVDEFVPLKMEKYSMREEYKKGSFKKQINEIIMHKDLVVKIQDKYRKEPLKDWFPWKPICDNCGKIATTQVTGCVGDKVMYKCQDYNFESTTAKGCGHQGINDPMKGNGKLMWKSEWAVGWAHWKISSEGAGKEYQVPGSAFWINAEIAEKILKYPAPQPIFYEHIMIDNQKMSASVGNVVYPFEWLEVAPPELLRFFYNKRLMQTRSFSWKDLPSLYDDLDHHSKVYHGLEKVENEKELKQMKRIYEISVPKKDKPVSMAFSHASIIAQIFENDEDIVVSLKKTGHYNKSEHSAVMSRIKRAKLWVEKYAPESDRFKLQDKVPEGLSLTELQKKALHEVASLLKKKEWNEQDLFNEFYNLLKNLGLKPGDFFKAGYMVLLNKERGPKLANFILAVGKDKVIELFEKV
ncbi:MAG: lysine--tRNA ligase [Nanoarchaeota archaeon]|nr:lysine--tRNA ligase [Nanoarchaeota archaeon]MBU1005262.1 lysine--tRNA ligase [Nanoarchaeota archaeon]MBU1946525.1 lysine--tRNA ligase [Nanoarchaeota archaeon]